MTSAAEPRNNALVQSPALTTRELADWLLLEDAMFQRVPQTARSTLLDAALEEGYACAEAVRRNWGTDPWTIARELNIGVAESHADAGFGSVVVLADYSQPPPRITLYSNAIAQLQRHFAGSPLDAPDYKAVFLAHELYHHLARLAPERSLTRGYRVTLLRLGRWCWTSGIAGLEEIAAGAFAQSLLSLSFHLRLLETLWARREPVAQDEGALR